jgi:GT2 family glycosyltransferase
MASPRQPIPIETSQSSMQKELDRLQSELLDTQQQVKRLLGLLEKQQARLNAQETSLARLDRILMEILTGRTWRALRFAGELAKKILPDKLTLPSSSKQSAPTEEGRKIRSFLVCDDPKPTDTRPRGGKVVVRGWCLAEGGVESVEIQVADLPPIRQKPNVPRPDVKKDRPDLDTTGRAGFLVDVDTSNLPNGQHDIKFRLFAQGRSIREARTIVFIDHEQGFASQYEQWIHEFEKPNDEVMLLKLPHIKRQPLISIVMPVYNTVEAELTSAIQSVIDQSYPYWELCIADDHSSKPEVKRVLDRFAGIMSTVKVAYRPEQGGISAASNTALAMATGEFVCFLDHDDTLAPHALTYLCEAIDRHPNAEFFYSDEDKIDAEGNRYDPFFKPEWSPDLLRSENYIAHLCVLCSDLLDRVGGFRTAFDGSQDYDLMLRASEKAAEIVHIPRVLYHWRAGMASTATTLENKSYTVSAAERALMEHCERLGNGGHVETGVVTGRWRIRYAIAADARVSIIIASGGKVDVLRTNLQSIFGKTTYPRYEVVVIDNSKHAEIEKLVSSFNSGPATLRYIDWRNKPFNYSAINNAAARTCGSPVLLFLNDDTSVIELGWLEAMVELVARPEVGAVGAKLLYPEGRIQHAGVVMGLFDNCGHAFKGLDGSCSHYFDFSDVIRNVSAITGACLMTKAELFWEVGGFDEGTFAVAFNDIDLSLKIGSLGYQVLYTPHAVLHHHEAFSKTSKDLVPHPEEVEAMRRKWGKIIDADPYYSPHLTRNDEDFSLRTLS